MLNVTWTSFEHDENEIASQAKSDYETVRESKDLGYFTSRAMNEQ